MVHHIVPMGFSKIDRKPTVRRELEDMVHYDHYDPSKYMSNQEIVEYLHALRGKTMAAYHAYRQTPAEPGAKG